MAEPDRSARLNPVYRITNRPGSLGSNRSHEPSGRELIEIVATRVDAVAQLTVPTHISAHFEEERYIPMLPQAAVLRFEDFYDLEIVSPEKARSSLSSLKGIGLWNTFLFGGSNNRPYVEKLVSTLARMPNGWAGKDSLPPSEAVIEDIERAFTALPLDSRDPGIEVDVDGTVVVEWFKGGDVFALTFTGNGNVIGTLSPWRPEYAPWILEVNDEVSIASRLEDPVIADIVA